MKKSLNNIYDYLTHVFSLLSPIYASVCQLHPFHITLISAMCSFVDRAFFPIWDSILGHGVWCCLDLSFRESARLKEGDLFVVKLLVDYADWPQDIENSAVDDSLVWWEFCAQLCICIIREDCFDVHFYLKYLDKIFRFLLNLTVPAILWKGISVVLAFLISDPHL